MSSSEEMAYILYQTWHKEATPSLPVREWDDLKDWQQRGYLAQVNALLEHLLLRVRGREGSINTGRNTMSEVVQILKVAVRPEDAEYLADIEYQMFLHKMAGKPIAIQDIRREDWEEKQEMEDGRKITLYKYRIRMHVSGEPEVIAQFKQEFAA